MDKMIVAIFENEELAYQGFQALEQVADEGNVAIYASAIITKNQDGQVVLQDEEEEGPLATSVGMLVGSLIGLLGGPVGVALGASGGAMIGSIDDFKKAGVSAQFLEEVSHKLLPGFSAVVAEIAEGWTAPLNSRLKECGGILLRCRRADVVEHQMERQIAAEETELAELKTEWEGAIGDDKASIKATIDRLESKLKRDIEHAWVYAEKLANQAEAKIKKIESQIAKANSELKAKLEDHIDNIRRDYDARIQKLKQAGKLTADALV